MLITIITPWAVVSFILGGIFLIAVYFTFIHGKEEKKKAKKEAKEEKQFLEAFEEHGV